MQIRNCCARISLAMFAVQSCSAQNSPGRKWYHEPFTMMQTNLREIDVEFDADQAADEILKHGAEGWLFNVGGILASYPTDLEFQIRNRFLSQRKSGDLVQDAVDAARARNMRLVARMDFSKIQLSVAQEHPDWLFISPNGTWQNHTNDLVSVCPSGPWYQERIFDILDEVITRYPVDGFFVNWANMNERDYWLVYHGVCHCQNCQNRWSNYTDAELPNGPEDDTYVDWRQWSDEIIEEWSRKVRAFIDERLPDGAVMLLGTAASVRYFEANKGIGRDLWPHVPAEYVSKYVSGHPDVPVLASSSCFYDVTYRLASEEPHRVAQDHLQSISRGGNPQTYIMATPGKIPLEAYDQAGEILRFRRDHKDIYAGLRPVAKTGLVLAQENAMEANAFEDARSEFRGLYKTLQELHVPFDVIGAESIPVMEETGGLQRYEVIILPNLGPLSSNATEFLDKWVVAGGTLVATGAVGVDDDDQLQLKSLPASAQINTTTDEKELWSHYFAPEQNRTEKGYYTGPIIPIIGGYFEYEWKQNSQGVYKLLDFAPFSPPEYASGNVQVDVRGVGIGKYGNGTSILFPFTPGRGYYEIGLGQFRDFFQLILDRYAAKEKLHFDLAEQVELTLLAKEGMTVVHLINMSGERLVNMGSYLQIVGDSLKVEGRITACALVAGKELEVNDGQIQLPELNLFEVLVIEGIN